ncbi:MAG: phosphoglycerate kinase [Candidatus Dadabacteria bacterium]
MNLISIDELDVREKRVFIRADFNVPIVNGQILDDTKIFAALPTIEYASKEKARVIIASHLGRPGGKLRPKLTLEPVGRRLSEILKREIFFPEDCIGDVVKKIAGDLAPGGIMLLENLRFHKGEEENDPKFAKRLAQVADVYVNEAFSVSHRLHASVVGILDFIETACVGLGFKNEIKNLTRLIENPKHPFIAVFGGRSAQEKIPIMESLLDKVDAILVGGAVSNTFLKVLGKEIGKSAVDEIALYSASRFISSASARGIRVVLPQDFMVVRGSLNKYSAPFVTPAGVFSKDGVAADIGPKTIDDFALRLSRAKTIFWNGPLGIYENEDFIGGTKAVAQAVGASGAFSVASGWDTVLAIKKMGFSGAITHLSTGGRASLEFVGERRLPALEALEKRFK